MRLSSENWRARWSAMAAAWLVVGALVVMDVAAIRDHLSYVASRGARANPAMSTDYREAFSPGAIDGQVWVIHARTLLENPTPRLRHTDMDNAPSGREMHWNTGWLWTIAGVAWLDHNFTRDDISVAMERTTRWLSPAVLLLVIVLFSSYVARHAGAAAGVAIAIGMAGHDYFFDGFPPSYVDHHGLLNAASFGVMLGAVFAGAGWWRQRDSGLLPASTAFARRAAVVSALSGAFGMWISAASAVPPIGIVGIAGLATILLTGRSAAKAGAQFDGGVWRTWGRVGGAACLAFYLVEYFPQHMGVRLEVNHPLYALAWWGGGELIAEIGERWLGPAEKRWANPRKLITSAALVLAPPVVIAAAGVSVFVLLDPFLGPLHTTYLTEFTPLWTAFADGLRWNPYRSLVGMENLPLVVGAALLVARRGVSPIVWFATIAVLGFTAMAWAEMRWLLNASGPQICLALVLVAYLTTERTPKVRRAAVIATFAVLFLPALISRVAEARGQVARRDVDPKEDLLMIYRDVAGALRASQPSGEITLLANPNASPAASYYGEFRTIGTPYWENMAGAKAAAEMLSARTADEAAALIRARGVTHIAMFTGQDFLRPYYLLLHPGASNTEFEQSFGYQLLYNGAIPTWLQMIPYRVPDDLAGAGVQVLLFKVDFDQTPSQALYNVAVSKVALGDFAGAEADFDTLIKRDALEHLPWLGKAGLLFTRREWVAASDVALAGIGRAPAGDRAGMYEHLATTLIAEGQPALALRAYRTALRDAFSADIACAFAFMLSTSTDARLRNGNEAVALARRALATQPDGPPYLLCLGTALAEAGQFAEAATTAERAMSIAESQRDADAYRAAAQMLTEFRARRAWRR